MVFNLLLRVRRLVTTTEIADMLKIPDTKKKVLTEALRALAKEGKVEMIEGSRVQQKKYPAIWRVKTARWM